jgi:DNA repair protein RadC
MTKNPQGSPRRILPIEGFSDGELLAYIAGPAAPRLLERFGTLGAVMAARPGDLAAAGCQPAAVQAIKVAQEAACRVAREAVLHRQPMSCWQQVVEYARTRIGHEPTECVLLLFLDRKNLLIADEVHQRGTVDHAPVYPREVLRRALELDACALVLAHNHPSGDPQPSRGDIDMTGRIVVAAKALGIDVHDHVVVARSGHYSMREHGVM